LGEVVRAPGIIWSTDTLDCRQIASEDIRLDALAKANVIERHRLVRERNIQLVQWLIPYYGWVATARAGMLDDEIKHVDIVIEDAGDRRLELKQFGLAENCAGATAKISNAVVVAPMMAAPPATLGQPDTRPTIQHEDPPPRVARSSDMVPALTPPAAHTSAARPATVAAPSVPAPAVAMETGTRVEGRSVILPLGPGADVDRAAAEITAALQQR
jgi:hypothetical protein